MYNSNNNDKEECNFLDFYLKESLQNQYNTSNELQENIEEDEFPFRKKEEVDYESHILMSDNTEDREESICNEIEVQNNYTEYSKEILEETKEDKLEETIKDSDSNETKIELINNLLEEIVKNTQTIRYLLSTQTPEACLGSLLQQTSGACVESSNSNNQIIEGIFDGEKMIGNNGKQYSMAANYISKSKLVQGDELKLNIKQDGTFIYKQINQVERISIIARLEITSDRKYFITNQNQQWRVLKASITYYQGTPGDQVIALIPKYEKSTWAAVERIASQ